jgi:hypothetical protein
MTQITRDEWLHALGTAAAPCDPDAFSTAEIAKMFDIPLTAAARKIRELVAAGKATQTFKSVTMVNGHAKRVPAYKLVKHEAYRPTRKR